MYAHSHLLGTRKRKSPRALCHTYMGIEYSAFNGSSNEEQKPENIRKPPIPQLLLPMGFNHPQHIACRILRIQVFKQMILLVLLSSQCPCDLRPCPHAANPITRRLDIVEKRAPEQLPLRFGREERRAGSREPDTWLGIITTFLSVSLHGDSVPFDYLWDRMRQRRSSAQGAVRAQCRHPQPCPRRCHPVRLGSSESGLCTDQYQQEARGI